MGGREVFYSIMIRSWSFSESVPLRCEPSLFLSRISRVGWNWDIFFPPLGRLESAAVGYLLYSRSLGSDKARAG